MKITVDLENLSANTREFLAAEAKKFLENGLIGPLQLLLLTINEDIQLAVSKNGSIVNDIVYILPRDKSDDAILNLLNTHSLEEEEILYLAKAFQHRRSRYNTNIERIKTALIDQKNISSETIAIILKSDPYSGLMYNATGKEQISSDTLKFILESSDSSLIVARALKHKNTRYEDIEEYIFSHKYNFNYDFCVVRFYLCHPQTSSESIYAFANCLLKQYMNSSNKTQTSFEHLLLEIIENPKTDSKTLFWLVTETRKHFLLCDTNMIKKLRKALRRNPNTTESILWEASKK